MGETLTRLMTPPGTNVQGQAPQPVSRNDEAIAAADRARRAAAAQRTGLGQTRLTAGLGDTGGSNKTKLLGAVGG